MAISRTRRSILFGGVAVILPDAVQPQVNKNLGAEEQDDLRHNHSVNRLPPAAFHPQESFSARSLGVKPQQPLSNPKPHPHLPMANRCIMVSTYRVPLATMGDE